MAGCLDPNKDAEVIPDEDFVYRNISFFQWKKHKPKNRPNEADFVPDSDGLSVNWDRYCSLTQAAVLLGLNKNAKGNFINPRDFRIIKFNVGELRKITLSDGDGIKDVIHDPLLNNYSHSLICFDDDEEIRLKICDLVEAQYVDLVLTPNYEEVEAILEQERPPK